MRLRGGGGVDGDVCNISHLLACTATSLTLLGSLQFNFSSENLVAIVIVVVVVWLVVHVASADLTSKTEQTDSTTTTTTTNNNDKCCLTFDLSSTTWISAWRRRPWMQWRHSRYFSVTLAADKDKNVPRELRQINRITFVGSSLSLFLLHLICVCRESRKRD